MKYRMGIDVGTTNVKAAAFDEAGGLAAYMATPTPIVHPTEAWSEFEPEAMWQAVCNSVCAVSRQVGADNITSIGISSMAETGVPLDRDGQPLYNFIAWYDMRSEPQCESLLSGMGKSRIYQITGQTASAKYGITKLMWLRDAYPDIYEHTHHWLSMEDYILWRLTGRMATDYSVASRTMAFDIHECAWSEEILEQAGISSRLFSEAHPGGTAIGKVTRDAARACGLAEGTAVSTGGHDHACAAIAVNVLEEGVILDSMGTSEVIMVAMRRPEVSEEALGSFFSIYPHCGSRMYRALTSNQACGLGIEWFLQSFCPDMLLRESREGISRYDQLFQQMRIDPERHEGLFFLPMIRGTVEQTGMHGGFVGITDLHDRGDFIAAMVDGILYEVKRQVEGYGRILGETYDKVRVVGGVSKAAAMMQRKADIQNMRVQVPRVTEAACMGAAILGAVGAGQMSLDEIGNQYRFHHEYVPMEARADKDQARFAQYDKLRGLALAANLRWRGGGEF